VPARHDCKLSVHLAHRGFLLRPRHRPFRLTKVSPIVFRPDHRIRDIERPHDLEALEHGGDLVVYFEPFTPRLTSEIAAVGIEPPGSRAVPSPSSQANASST
jgi:hypothetical protein